MTNFSHNFAGAGAVVADSVTVTGTVTAGALVGPLTGNTTGTHTGPVATDALTVRDVAVVAPPPNTSAELLAALSPLTSVAAWRLDRVGVASGTVASIGNLAATLTMGGTPTVGHPQAQANGGTARGIYFDASTLDALSADVLDPAATSFVAGVRCALVADPDGTDHHLIGRNKATGGVIPGWTIYVGDAGDLKYWISDGTHIFSATFAAGALAIGAPPIEIVPQLDRSGAQPVFRARWSRNGVNLGAYSATLADLGSLTAAGQEFGFGAIPVAAPSFNGGAWVQWAWFASGTQAEGVSLAQTVSQGLGWEQ
jgi:hypothetical protein